MVLPSALGSGSGLLLAGCGQELKYPGVDRRDDLPGQGLEDDVHRVRATGEVGDVGVVVVPDEPAVARANQGRTLRYVFECYDDPALESPLNECDDATQEVLVELAKFLPRFEGRSKLSTVAHTITVRVAYRYFGARDTVALESVPEPLAPTGNVDDRMMAREALARIQAVISRQAGNSFLVKGWGTTVAAAFFDRSRLSPTKSAKRPGAIRPKSFSEKPE